MNVWEAPALVEVPSFRDEFGALGVVEKSAPFPFALKRVYFLYDVPSDAVRGSHAHRNLYQLIVPISGSFQVVLDDGKEAVEFSLRSPNLGLTVPPGYWRTLTNFSSGSAALVFASEEYDADDYIRDYEDFKRWANS